MALRPRLARISRRTLLLTALGVASAALYAVFVPVHVALYGTPLPLAFLLGVALCAAPLLSLSRPRTAIALFCASAFAIPLIAEADRAATAPWPLSVPTIIIFVIFVGIVTGVHGARLGIFPLAIGTVASLLAPLLRPDIMAVADVTATATADLIVTASVATAAFVLAILIAGRVRVGAELTREREHSALEESRRALVEERTRIARELHDVIAHSMSVIQVQASTARYRLPSIDDDAVREFDDIAATARASLTEMRRMLGVLRTENQATELEPQKGLDDIPALVDTMRRAGLEAGLALIGADASTAVPAAVQIAAYRIVQEALSNAVRHAPGSAVTVHVQADAASLRIRVRNDAPASAADRGIGHGLRGMRERTELLGGTLTAGPSTGDVWQVEAMLPNDPERGASDGIGARGEDPRSGTAGVKETP